ncbi:MAG: NAD(P)H-binding protein [Myxococcales bacterium]|nr:NAD(P)H-binding protein [Myxococcales bacterium]
MTTEPTRLVLVTGATGFVGAALVPALTAAGLRVRATTRDLRRAHEAPGVTWVRCDVGRREDLERALAGVDAVFFLVHAMGGGAHDYGETERRAALALREAAEAARVARIVYLGGVAPAGALRPPEEPARWWARCPRRRGPRGGAARLHDRRQRERVTADRPGPRPAPPRDAAALLDGLSHAPHRPRRRDRRARPRARSAAPRERLVRHPRTRHGERATDPDDDRGASRPARAGRRGPVPQRVAVVLAAEARHAPTSPSRVSSCSASRAICCRRTSATGARSATSRSGRSRRRRGRR